MRSKISILGKIIIFFIFGTFSLKVNYGCADDSIMLFKDIEIESYLKKLAAPLLKAANLNPKAVNFYLVNQPNEINAFVYGGQNIFIFSGLLTSVDNDDELAGVLAHEISHITEGHLIQGAILNQKSQIIVLASLLVGILAAAASSATGGNQAGNILTVLATTPSISLNNLALQYSKADEMQADKHAIALLRNTSYNPKGILLFMQKLEQLEGNPNYVDSWFSTHPLTSTRVSFLQNYLKNIKPNNNFTVSNELLRVQVKLNALSLSYNEFINKYTQSNDTKLYGLAIANYLNSNYTVAINIMKELILKHPEDPYFLELLGDLYQTSNNFEGAYRVYTKAYRYNNNYLLDFKIANAAYNINTPLMLDESLKHLNIMLEKNYASPSAWQIKAMILARQNKPFLSKWALAEKYFSSGDILTAKQYATAALIGIDKNQAEWIRLQDILLK